MPSRTTMSRVALSALGSLLVTPLVLLVAGLGLALLIGALHHSLSLPFIFTGTYFDGDGGGVEVEAEPAFAAVAVLLAAAIGCTLFRVDRRFGRARPAVASAGPDAALF